MTFFGKSVRAAIFAAAASVAVAVPAHAGPIVLFDNFTATVDGSYAIYGANTLGGLNTASAFTPSVSALFDSVTIAADYWLGNSAWTVSLASDASGLPGANLETIAVTLPAYSGSPQMVTIASSFHTALVAGTQYWIVLGADASNPGGAAEWFEYKGGGLGAQQGFLQFTSAWSIASGSSISAPSMHVEGTTGDLAAVPEPASLLLLGTGIAAGVRRLRRKTIAT